MKITIDGTVYGVDATSVTNREAMTIEDEFGMTFQEFGQLLGRGSMKALTGLAWIIMRRTDSEVAFDAVDFKLADAEDDVPLGAADTSSADGTP